MNIKDFIGPFVFALAATWALQTFWFNSPSKNTVSDRTGTTFTAPTNVSETKPLIREVDFIDTHSNTPEQLTRVETACAVYTLSNRGATVARMEFKPCLHGSETVLTTIDSTLETQREHLPFLVALDTKTPFNYQLISNTDYDDRVVLVYRAVDSPVGIEKTYTLYKQLYKMDLALTITPANGQPVTPRLLFSAPLLQDASIDSIPRALFAGPQGKVQSLERSKIDINTGWFKPNFFGSQDKYFVHALVSDPLSFVQRAYYDLAGKDQIISILESAPITDSTTWTLSFYVGPKEEHAMNQVDVRLQESLDYAGWLAPISRVLLKILQWIYSFAHNYGIAIILVTLLIRLILFPFTIKSETSMKKQSEVQKKLAYIQQKYKSDPQRLALERAELIKKNGMPGLGGCLPLLIQIPVFFALSRVLSSSIQLYQAPFAWIPDLSTKDPYYILPILMVVVMVIQALYAESSQRMSILAMSLVLGAVTSSLSAGLALYLVVSTALAVVQTIVQKKMKWA